MNPLSELHISENGSFKNSNEGYNPEVAEQMESFDGTIEGNLSQRTQLVEWLNGILPYLSLPLEASEEDLRACLIDGTVLCGILNRLSPGSIEMGGISESYLENLKRFLAAMEEMGLPRFELSDLEQGSMDAVLQCLQTLRAHFNFNIGGENIRNYSRKKWNLCEVECLEGFDRSQEMHLPMENTLMNL
ncbi:Kinesin-like protein KIN-14K [Vitis vinifera]|uniref:Kinesin-like protein KIN-14K n=1 Tax=Vitis vinifera TaxID=29760 RepID=A0A438JJT8_VITVI|nr:Kinesin-like protein KIN-14K [Vitis vinifera]